MLIVSLFSRKSSYYLWYFQEISLKNAFFVKKLPSDFAFNLSSVNNNIRLLADGDVNLQNAKLVATDSATARNTRTEGLEEWGLAASTDGFSGSSFKVPSITICAFSGLSTSYWYFWRRY